MVSCLDCEGRVNGKANATFCQVWHTNCSCCDKPAARYLEQFFKDAHLSWLHGDCVMSLDFTLSY
jgi:hypothetical protein